MSSSWKFTTALFCGFSVAFGALGQITKLPYADTTRGNYFGTSVALDGQRAIVGASGEKSCDTGGGAAYIYEFADSTGQWRQTARLVPRDCEQGLAFGRKVALHGRTALVAASQEFFANERSNAVYVYGMTDTGKWEQTERLTNRGNSQNEGAAGTAIAVHHNRALFTTGGDPSSGNEKDGAIYLYEKNTSTWNLAHRLTGSGTTGRGIFGGNAALYMDILAVASNGYFRQRTGSVHLFEFDQDESWSEVARLEGIRDFFISLDLYGNELIVGQSRGGSRESGEAILFARDSTGNWIKTATLSPPSPYRKGAFGTEVALYEDRALVVGYDEQLRLDFNVDRVVYIYARRDGQWHYQGILDIGESSFGSSIDLHGRTALIGAAGSADVGKAYIIQIP